jgi:hypothetical protein
MSTSGSGCRATTGASTRRAGSQGYQQNLFLRRARLIMGGDFGNQISFFFETDDPNLGKRPKR